MVVRRRFHLLVVQPHDKLHLTNGCQAECPRKLPLNWANVSVLISIQT